MPTYPLTFSDSGFPDPFTGSDQDFVDAFLQYLSASISSNNLLLGQIGGTMPVSNVGPWLDGNVWKIWDGSTYVPATQQISNSGFTITFGAETLTGDRTPQFQDKSGTVAMLSDVYDGRGTIVLPSTSTPEFDWSQSFSFYKSMSANNTASFSNYLPGQTIHVLISHVGTNTMTWPSYVKWEGGSEPAQTPSGVDLYEFFNLAGTIYGKQVGADFQTP